MKRLLCADLHLLRSSVREDEMFAVLDYITTVALSHGCSSIDVLGDLLDNRTFLSYRFWPRMQDWLNRTLDAGLQMNVLAGNHDFYGSVERAPSNLRFVQMDPRINVIDTITVSQGICWVPWLFANEQIPDTGYQLIFAHLPINGFNMSPGAVATEGVDLHTDVPVYAGDFHMAQKTGNICYIGSPIHHTWGDANQTKRVIILDDESLSAEDVTLNHLFTNLVKLHYNDVEKTILPGASRVTVTNVPAGTEELVTLALTNMGATSVECLPDMTEPIEAERCVAEGWSVADAIAHQIEAHPMRDELAEMHKTLAGAAS